MEKLILIVAFTARNDNDIVIWACLHSNGLNKEEGKYVFHYVVI